MSVIKQLEAWAAESWAQEQDLVAREISDPNRPHTPAQIACLLQTAAELIASNGLSVLNK